MENKIRELIKSYKLDVEGMTKHDTKNNDGIGIINGNGEGYYICITRKGTCYNLRSHDKNESLKILGVMLTLLK